MFVVQLVLRFLILLPFIYINANLCDDKIRGSFVFFLLVTEISFLMWIIFRYGEIVDVNLVRDKGTGKSKGFAFIAYEDQRSTNLAVGWFL